MHSIADLSSDEAIAALAAPPDIQAGQKIAENGGVQLDEFTPTRVMAHVTDPSIEAQDTLLEVSSDDLLIWHCTCAPSNKSLFCRHAVATALETRRKSPPINVAPV